MKETALFNWSNCRQWLSKEVEIAFEGLRVNWASGIPSFKMVKSPFLMGCGIFLFWILADASPAEEQYKDMLSEVFAPQTYNAFACLGVLLFSATRFIEVATGIRLPSGYRLAHKLLGFIAEIGFTASIVFGLVFVCFWPKESLSIFEQYLLGIVLSILLSFLIGSSTLFKRISCYSQEIADSNECPEIFVGTSKTFQILVWSGLSLLTLWILFV